MRARLRDHVVQIMASQKTLDTLLPAAKKKKTGDEKKYTPCNVTRLRMEEVWSILTTSVTVHAQLGYGTVSELPNPPSRTPPLRPLQLCPPKFKYIIYASGGYAYMYLLSTSLMPRLFFPSAREK